MKVVESAYSEIRLSILSFRFNEPTARVVAEASALSILFFRFEEGCRGLLRLPHDRLSILSFRFI